MNKTILISETSKETRIAILENEDLVEFFVEKPERTRMVGNIYKGKVENVVQGIQAAFIDIGDTQNAFLPFSEIGDPTSVTTMVESISHDDEEDREEKKGLKPRRSRVPQTGEINLIKGQDVLVQVIKEPFGTKGARVTTDISIPGRFLVLVPDVDFIGISKKIYDFPEKKRLRKVADSIRPKNFGLIIRTITKGKDKKTLNAELQNLVKIWHSIEKNVKEKTAPICVYSDMEMAASVIRDLLTPDVNKIIVDTKYLYKNLHAYIKSVSPEFIDKLKYYRSRNPLFEQYNIEKEFEKSLNKNVWLKSGGFIVIEHTEAMTTIDVNSGKFIGKKDHEKNSLKIDLQAAKEIARQLRLRDIGGLIVIDFIDMEEEENKKKIYQELERELRKDRAKVSLSPISEFGLLEMTRQRVRVNLLYTVSEECPTCHGSGRITSKESLVTKIESWFRRFKVKSKERRLHLHVQPEIAEYLRKSTGNLLKRIQWKNLLRIKIYEDSSVNINEFRVFSVKTGKDITDEY